MGAAAIPLKTGRQRSSQGRRRAVIEVVAWLPRRQRARAHPSNPPNGTTSPSEMQIVVEHPYLAPGTQTDRRANPIGDTPHDVGGSQRRRATSGPQACFTPWGDAKATASYIAGSSR